METLNFLWISGIRGDTQDPRHIGDFNVLTYTFSSGIGDAYLKLPLPGSGQAVKAQADDVHIAIRGDTRESQTLYAAAVKQQSIHTAILTIEKNMGGRSAGVFARFVMRDIDIFYLNLSRKTYNSPERLTLGISCKSFDVSHL